MAKKGRSVSDELEPMDTGEETVPPPPPPDPDNPPEQEIDGLKSVRRFTDENGKEWLHVHELIGNRWFDRCVPVGNR